VRVVEYTSEAATDEADDLRDEVCDLNDAFNPFSGPVADVIGC
jgi:hypothetical protein